jgi:hypothetical protein
MNIEPVRRVLAALGAPFCLIDGRAIALPVATPSDLILLKLAAGGFLDLRDVATLLEIGERDIIVSEVSARIGDLQPDVGALWREILKQTER